MKNISQIKKFSDYLNEDFADGLNELVYMSFDVDDNLLYMPTKIHMLHLEDGEWVERKVTTEEFAKIRSDKANWKYKPEHDGDASFEEFRDWGSGGRDTFLSQFKEAVLSKEFGPSWPKFIECLVNGYIFSIITSRGHSPHNVRRAIEWLIFEYGLDSFKNLPIENVDKNESFDDQMIENLLKYHELFGTSPEYVVDEYLDVCPIYTISSEEFMNKFGNPSMDDKKKIALADFNRIVKDYAKKMGVKAKYGFSDDDPKFVKAAIDQFRELKDRDHRHVKYTVFDTGDKQMKKIRV